MVHYQGAPTDRQPFFNAPQAVTYLISAIIFVHFVRWFLPTEVDWDIVGVASFIPARFFGDANGAATGLPDGAISVGITFLTHTFLHADLTHLGLNMVWLLAFGAPVARALGATRFLILYFVCGVAGALVHLAVHPTSLIPVIGASGAISGMMAGAIRYLFGARQPFAAQSRVAALSDPRLLLFIGIWVAANTFFGVTSVGPSGEDQLIAWEAHLGGFLAGLFLFPLMLPIRR
jgi:membrane associated rhomboid family serine protease